MHATPTKRRALGSLDVNITRSPTKSPSSFAKLAANNRGLAGLGGSPLKKKASTTTTTTTRRITSSPSPSRTKGATPTKRPFLSLASDGRDKDENVLLLPVAKKLCYSDAKDVSRAKLMVMVGDVDEDDQVPASQASTRRSISPDASSLFDTPSAINTSQLTNITEPDTDAAPATVATTTTTTTTTITAPTAFPAAAAAATTASTTTSATAPSSSMLDTLASLPPPRPRRVPTREEFRQKAEILKLRLSLATYKIKTNQTDVPLDQLQIRPVPGMAHRRTPLPSMSAHTIERATPVQYWYRSSARKPSSSQRRIDPAARDSDEDEDVEIDIPTREGNEDAAEEDDTEALPKLSPSAAALTTPRKRRNEADDEEKLTSSALRGGAAKGLLSLSQGSH